MAFLAGSDNTGIEGATVRKVPEGTTVVNGNKTFFSTMTKLPEKIHLKLPKSSEQTQFEKIVTDTVPKQQDQELANSELISLANNTSKFLQQMTSERGINLMPIRQQFQAHLVGRSEEGSKKPTRPDAESSPAKTPKTKKRIKKKEKSLRDSASDDTDDTRPVSDSDDDEPAPPRPLLSKRSRLSKKSSRRKVVQYETDSSDDASDSQDSDPDYLPPSKSASSAKKKYRAKIKKAKSVEREAQRDKKESLAKPPATLDAARSKGRRQKKLYSPPVETDSESSSDSTSSDASDSDQMSKPHPSKTSRRNALAQPPSKNYCGWFCRIMLAIIFVAILLGAGCAIFMFGQSMLEFSHEIRQQMALRRQEATSTPLNSAPNHIPDKIQTTPEPSDSPPVAQTSPPVLFGSSMIVYGSNVSLLQVTTLSLAGVANMLLQNMPLDQINHNYMQNTRINSLHFITDRNTAVQLSSAIGLPLMELYWTPETAMGNESRRYYANDQLDSTPVESLTLEYMAVRKIWCDAHGKPMQECPNNFTQIPTTTDESIVDAPKATISDREEACLLALTSKSSWNLVHSKAASQEVYPISNKLKLYGIHSMLLSLSSCTPNNPLVQDRLRHSLTTLDEHVFPIAHRGLTALIA